MSDLRDREAWVVFCTAHSEQTGSEAMFDVLVDLAAAYIQTMQAEDQPDLERPETFEPKTLAGVSYLDAAVTGLRENLDMREDL
jgi:hypothetical protein